MLFLLLFELQHSKNTYCMQCIDILIQLSKYSNPLSKSKEGQSKSNQVEAENLSKCQRTRGEE